MPAGAGGDPVPDVVPAGGHRLGRLVCGLGRALVGFDKEQGMGQKKPRGPQVLAFGSIYQGSILGTQF